MIQSILNRIEYGLPETVKGSDYTVNNIFEIPVAEQLEYLAEQTIVIGTKTASNELFDMKNSYLTWEDTVSLTYTGTQAAYIAWAAANPLERVALSAGVPFESITETINGNTIIAHCPRNFGRFKTLGLLAQPELENMMHFGVRERDTGNVQWLAAPSAPLGLIPSTGTVDSGGPHPYGLMSHPFKSLINTRMVRNNYNIVVCNDGTLPASYRKCILPLTALSRLATAPCFIPLGLINNVSGNTWEMRLKISENIKLYETAVSGNFESNYVYRLRKPRLAIKTISINNPLLFEQLNFRYNSHTPLRIPFNNSEYTYDTLLANSSRQTFHYNLRHRAIKGCAVRFLDSNGFAGECHLLSDSSLIQQLRFQFTIGRYQYPKVMEASNNLGAYANDPVESHVAKTGNHLIRPDGGYSSFDNLAVLRDPLYYNSGTNKFSSFTVSFENLSDSLEESLTNRLSSGIDTLANGLIRLELSYTPILYPVEVQIEWIYQDLLLCAPGIVRCVYDEANLPSML